VDLRTNLGLKLTALFLALAAWVYVHNLGDILKVLTVPVDMTGIPDSLELVGDHPPDINVRLRGPDLTLGNLPPQRVVLRADLADMPLRPGTNTIPLDSSMVQVPAGISVDRLSPSSFDITLEPRVDKEVPVVVNLQGKPAEGYEVVGTSVVPARVMVSGPESVIKKLDSIYTAPFSIENARDTKHMELEPLSTLSTVRLASPGARVEVAVRIRPRQTQATLEGVKILATGVPAASSSPTPGLEPATVTVHVAGSAAVIGKLTAADLLAVLDLRGRTGQNMELATADLVVRAADPEALDVQALTLTVAAPDKIRVTWTGGKSS